MRLLKLAWRILARRERSHWSALLALALSSAFVTMSVSVLDTTYRVEKEQRRGVMGEYHSFVARADLATMREEVDAALSAGHLVLSRVSVPAFRGSPDAMPVLLALTDPESERLFRGVTAETGSPSVELLTTLAGRVSVAIEAEYTTPDGVPELVVSDTPEVRRLTGTQGMDVELIVRGEAIPLKSREGRRLEAIGFASTEWSRPGLGKKAAPALLLSAGVTALASLPLMAALLLLVRQRRADLALLRSWGFRPWTLRSLVVTVGVLAGGSSAVVGAIAGAVITTIAGYRGTSSLVTQWFSPIVQLTSTDVPIAPTIGAIVLAAALGVLVGLAAGLPMIRAVDRIITGDDKWFRR
jgi:hypothetical protein